MVILLSMSIFINLLLIIGLLLTIKIINNKLKLIDKYEEWVLNLQQRLHNTYIKLKIIDDRKMFESDDDVGFVFKEILQLIKDIDDKTQYEEVQKESDGEETK